MPERLKVYVSPLIGIYPDYNVALEACISPLYARGDVRTDEIEYFRIIRKIRRNVSAHPGATMSARLAPYLDAVKTAGGRGLRILDVGGTDGRYYHWLHKILGSDAVSVYHVLEAPAVAALGRRIASPPVSFFGAPDEVPAGHYDIVVFGAMLQVLPDPASFFDDVLSKVTWSQVVVTVFPFRSDLETSFISAKRPTGSMGYPYRVFGRDWIRKFESMGSVKVMDMPSYQYSLGGRRYPQSAVTITR